MLMNTMDSIVWPYHTSELLLHIWINNQEILLLYDHVNNLCYYKPLIIMDSIVLLYHRSRLLLHVFINEQESLLFYNNIC